MKMNSDVPFQVNFTSSVIISSGIFVGRNVWKSFALNSSCYIQGCNGIYMGDDAMFAPVGKIISANHDPKNHMVWKQAPPIHIGSRCWIGAGAIILPGLEIGDDCVVGAGTVVTHSIEFHSTVVGNPARTIGKQMASP